MVVLIVSWYGQGLVSDTVKGSCKHVVVPLHIFWCFSWCGIQRKRALKAAPAPRPAMPALREAVRAQVPLAGSHSESVRCFHSQLAVEWPSGRLARPFQAEWALRQWSHRCLEEGRRLSLVGSPHVVSLGTLWPLATGGAEVWGDSEAQLEAQESLGCQASLEGGVLGPVLRVERDLEGEQPGGDLGAG